MKKNEAMAAAATLVDDGTYRDALATLVAFETDSQDATRHDRLYAYLETAIGPMLKDLGFSYQVFDNPVTGGGPILVGTRHENDGLPTILSYGHGDVVTGMDSQWTNNRRPFELSETSDKLFGRGTADNKGQHLLNLMALAEVHSEREGRLGFNMKFLMETSEEIGAIGLHQFVTEHRDLLAADVLIASDGPRVSAEVPTMVLGLRGVLNFTLSIDLRTEAHHSGNWGGFIADPAILMAHAIAAISTSNGRLNVPEWRPSTLDPTLRAALQGCPFDPGDSGDQPDDWWGEPNLSVWEKTALWPSFTVLAMDHGDPDRPVNAIQPGCRAHCGVRYPAVIDPDIILPSLQRFLEEQGLERVRVSADPSAHMKATCSRPDDAWSTFVARSIERSTGKEAQVLPSNGGSLPNDVFADLLGLETIWIPHSYNSCCQHAPDEHVRKDIIREGISLMAGLWWDLGESDTPQTKKADH